jgi:hypothetical protein
LDDADRVAADAVRRQDEASADAWWLKVARLDPHRFYKCFRRSWSVRKLPTELFAPTTLGFGRGLGACVGSAHADGFVRQRSVEHLNRFFDPIVAAFVAIAATDHVKEVRETAFRLLGQRTAPDSFKMVLPILIMGSGFDPAADAVKRYLALAAANGEDVATLAYTASYRERFSFRYGPACATHDIPSPYLIVHRLGFRLLDQSGRVTAQWAADAYLREWDPFNKRKMVQRVAQDLTLAERVLLDSPWAEGRLEALRVLPFGVISPTKLSQLLMDKASRVRKMAKNRSDVTEDTGLSGGLARLFSAKSAGRDRPRPPIARTPEPVGGDPPQRSHS